MKTIGLIGGMSWESTLVYYRLINESVRARMGGLHSAEIVMRSLDFEAVVACQKAGRWDLAADHLAEAAAGLGRAGADFGLICTNTMHLVADAVEGQSGLKLIHIVDETAKALLEAGRQRPLLLATRYTMEHGFYAERMARHGVAVQVPDAADRAVVHGIIFDELCRGEVKPASRLRLLDIVQRGLAAGADSVILGCTEICLILDPNALRCPGFDSTRIHAEAAVEAAFAGDVALDLARAS